MTAQSITQWVLKLRLCLLLMTEYVYTLGPFQRIQSLLVYSPPLIQNRVMRKQKTKKHTKLSQSITWRRKCNLSVLCIPKSIQTINKLSIGTNGSQSWMHTGITWGSDASFPHSILHPTPPPTPHPTPASDSTDCDRILWWFYWAAQNNKQGLKQLHRLVFPKLCFGVMSSPFSEVE